MKPVYLIICLSIIFSSCFKSKKNNDAGIIDPYEQLSAIQENSVLKSSGSWTSWIGDDTIGSPYIANFTQNNQFDKHNYAIEQDANGIMLIANRKGLLVYDGKEWNMVKLKQYAFTLKKDPISGHILAGCHGGFGLVATDSHGLYQYAQMSPDNIHGDFTDIAIFSKYIFFYSNTAVYIYSRTDSTIKQKHQASVGSKFDGFVTIGEHFFVNSNTQGLYEVNLENSSSVKLKTKTGRTPNGVSLTAQEGLQGENIIFSIPFSKTQALFGASNNKMYLFDGQRIEPFNCDADGLLKSASINNGVNLSDDEFALSTVNGGCVLISKSTKKTLISLNYQTGLLDDEIQAIGTDASKGLWLSLPNGLSRVNFGLHVKNYSSLPGLDGKLLSVSEANKSVYAGTTAGAYLLYKVKDVKEITKYIKTKQVEDNIVDDQPKEVKENKETKDNKLVKSEVLTKKENLFNRVISKVNEKIKTNLLSSNASDQKDKGQTQTQNQNQTVNQVQSQTQANKETKQPWWAKLVGKKPKEENTQTQADNSHSLKTDLNTLENKDNVVKDNPVTSLTSLPVTNTKKQKVVETSVPQKLYALQSIKYAFKRVEGINDRCKAFYNTGEKLFVAGNTGAYEVIGEKANQILKDRYVNSIYQSTFHPNRYYFCCNTGLVQLTAENGKWEESKNFAELEKPIYSVVEENEQTLWLGSENMTYKIDIDKTGAPLAVDPFVVGNHFFEPIYVKKQGNSIAFYTETGIFKMNAKSKSIESEKLKFEVPEQGMQFLFGKNNNWVYNGTDWQIPYETLSSDTLLSRYFNAFDQVVNVFVPNQTYFWLVDKSKSLFKVRVEKRDSSQNSNFNVFLKTISYNNGSKYVDLSELTVDFDNSSLKFNILAPFYLKENSVKFQYRIEGKGFTGQWSNWQDETSIKFPYLPAGSFVLIIKAKNVLGNICPEKTFYFSVKPPFWQTWWFYSLIIALIAYCIYAIIKWRTASLEKDKQILEQKVAERTAEIEKQKHKIEKANTEIKDSIEYASRIQKAALPNKDILDSLPINYFIYFRPKDIVSGDYYWFSRVGKKLIITAADCTGHGVPGGFLSMLGMAFLNDIVVKDSVTVPGTILDHLREKIINQLHQSDTTIKDGMDISLCVIDFETLQLWYAGAYNPLYLLRDGALNELHADRMPVGVWVKGNNVHFNTQQIEIKRNDLIYLSSDGYCDQFGGPKGRKFLPKNFRDTLTTMSSMAMPLQYQHLSKTMDGWKQGFEQVDDMLVIGVQVK